MPDSILVTNDGIVLIANGIDDVIQLDQPIGAARPLAVPAPTTAAVITLGTQRGGIAGTYRVYVRYLDENAKPGNLSPASADIEAKFGAAISITEATDATPIVITSASAHGLTAGDRVFISGALSNTSINGSWEITVLTTTTFSLVDSRAAGTYLGGASFVAGIDKLLFAVPAYNGEPNVKTRQVLRNTAGQAEVYYVDVQTDDLTSTTLESTRNDSELSSQEPVALFSDTGVDLAVARYTAPPNDKAVLAQHLGRIFLAVDEPYSLGAVAVTYGSLTVTGIGTEWPATLANRILSIEGATSANIIASVDPTTQIATLETPFLGIAGNTPYAAYSIRGALENSLAYSDAGEIHAWPPDNNLGTIAENDTLTGMYAWGSFLYIIRRSSVSRLTFKNNPDPETGDGQVFPSVFGRGCVNQRCILQAGDATYMLDTRGIWSFNGDQQAEDSSFQIANTFQSDNPIGRRINWSAQRWFHAVLNPAQAVARWFVSLDGYDLPRHAIVFAHDQKRWWLEGYPFPVTSSVTGLINGRPAVLLGSTGKRIFALEDSSLDVATGVGTTRGTATSAGTDWIADTVATFDANVVGAPCCIVAGLGKGQIRNIAEVTSATKLTMALPWAIQPDATSIYQVGGIQWMYRAGEYYFINWNQGRGEEQQNKRGVKANWQPLGSGVMDVRIYNDFSELPITFKRTVTTADGSGAAVVEGNDYAEFDLTKVNGQAYLGMPSGMEGDADAPGSMTVELGGVANAEPLFIRGLILEGVDA